jgi:hypothetical protein
MERVRRYIMSKEGIGFFKAILESYEDVALMTVLDGKTGEVEVIYASSAEQVVESIIADMARFNITFREVGHV